MLSIQSGGCVVAISKTFETQRTEAAEGQKKQEEPERCSTCLREMDMFSGAKGLSFKCCYAPEELALHGFQKNRFLMLGAAFTIGTKTVRIVRLHGTIAAITGKAVLSRPETAGASGEVSAIVYIAKDRKRRACSLGWRRRALKYDEGEGQHRKFHQ